MFTSIILFHCQVQRSTIFYEDIFKHLKPQFMLPRCSSFVKSFKPISGKANTAGP